LLVMPRCAGLAGKQIGLSRVGWRQAWRLAGQQGFIRPGPPWLGHLLNF
jgi:hypothetical protein